MPITSLASQSGKAYQAGQSDDGWQRFTQLVAAVNAGNLPAAQKAYDGFAKSAAADLTKASPASRLAKIVSRPSVWFGLIGWGLAVLLLLRRQST